MTVNRRRQGSIAGDDVGDIGGSDRTACCGCRVIMAAGRRQALKHALDRQLGRERGWCRERGSRTERGNPGGKGAGGVI
jgi:hypothetical protein